MKLALASSRLAPFPALITRASGTKGQSFGKGSRLDHLMAELFGKSTGVCYGLGGSMHLADPEVGILRESAIVGDGITLAADVALSFCGDNHEDARPENLDGQDVLAVYEPTCEAVIRASRFKHIGVGLSRYWSRME